MADTTLSVSLTPGYTFQAGELVTIDKLNQLGNPTILLTAGSLGTLFLLDGSVTTAKLASSPPALAIGSEGWSKMADHYVTTAKLSVSPPAVTNNELADNAVAPRNLQPGAVGPDAITDNTLPGAKLKDGTVTFPKLDPVILTDSNLVHKTTPAGTDRLIIGDMADPVTAGKSKYCLINDLAGLVVGGFAQGAVGQYHGQASGNIQVVVGFAPDFVFVNSDGQNEAYFAFNVGAKNFCRTGNLTNTSNAGPVCTFLTTGFQVPGGAVGVSQSSNYYNYIALKLTHVGF